MLIDKEKTQIDVATDRMMTWTENLEEEGVVEEEVDEPVEDADYDSNEDEAFSTVWFITVNLDLFMTSLI